MVAKILDRMDYLGHTVNFKTHVKSYKVHKTIYNSPDQWKIFEGTHEAIIDKETFEIVQKIRAGKRRPTRMGEMPMFSGLLYCADCGRKLSFHRKEMRYSTHNAIPQYPNSKKHPYETLENQGFLAKEKHRNPDTHCIKIAVLIWRTLRDSNP